jgi:hypothetical protein
MADYILNVPLEGQLVGYDNKPLMQPGPNGKLTQHGFMACWYASACMVSHYQRAGPRLGLPAVWKADTGLSLSAINQLAAAEGLQVVPKPPGGLNEANTIALLRKYGPIWAAGHYVDTIPGAGHAIVLTGVRGPFVLYNDPAEPKAKQRPWQWIDSKLLNLPNALLAKNPLRS